MSILLETLGPICFNNIYSNKVHQNMEKNVAKLKYKNYILKDNNFCSCLATVYWLLLIIWVINWRLCQIYRDVSRSASIEVVMWHMWPPGGVVYPPHRHGGGTHTPAVLQENMDLMNTLITWWQTDTDSRQCYCNIRAFSLLYNHY